MEHNKTLRIWGGFLLLLLLTVIFLIWNLFAGSVRLSASEILEILRGGAEGSQRSILLQIRLPRLVAALILGVVIIFMGMKVMRTSVSVDTFQAKHYNTDSMTFGADFYTEIYRASDTIVDELSELNSGVETISESVAELANVIYEPVGTLIVTLGIGVIAVSLCHIKSKS